MLQPVRESTVRPATAVFGEVRAETREARFRLKWSAGRTLVASALVLAAILALHYAVPPDRLGWHDALRRLLYIPVVAASIAGGTRAGVLFAAAAAAGYAPHLLQLVRAGDRALDHVFEFILLALVGALIGRLADSSRRFRAQSTERGRLAALGEVGVAAMRQAEGPLAAIEGQAESLRFFADGVGRSGMRFAVDTIRAEAARARRFLSELQALERPRARRVRSVNLSALVAGVIGDIRSARPAPPNLVLVPIAERTVVRGDPKVMAYSLRLLLTGLLESIPEESRIDVRLDAESKGTGLLTLGVWSERDPLPDLEGALQSVFGAAIPEYRFERALCAHLLAAEGANVEFQRVDPYQVFIRVRFSSNGIS